MNILNSTQSSMIQAQLGYDKMYISIEEMVIVNTLDFWDFANCFKRRQFAELRHAAFD